MEVLKAVLHSAKFWTLVVAMVQTIVFQYVPNFPPAIWQGIDGIAGVVIGSLIVYDTHTTKREVKNLKEGGGPF